MTAEISERRTEREGAIMPGTVSPETVADQILWLRREIPTTPLHIVKLVYLCHGWMLGLKGRPLINEPIVVGQHGPVIENVYDKFKAFGSEPIFGIKPSDHSADLDPEQSFVVEFVHHVYDEFKDTDLSEMTHEDGTPWSEAHETAGIGTTIPEDAIKHHYEEMIRDIREDTRKRTDAG